MKDDIKKYLEQDVRFRERRNKSKGIAELLRRKYPEAQALPRDTLVAILEDYVSYERLWRMLLQEHPELRGTDYADKKWLESEAQQELGYHVEKTPQLV